jgi:molybdate transport system ATP-binding protein
MLEGVSVQLGGARLLDNLDWTIHRGEQWALTGASGSGKTLLAHTLLGRHFHTGHITFYNENGVRLTQPRISIVEQQHRFRGRPGHTELYYQQRFNASDADQTITVAQELADAGCTDPALTDTLHIGPLLQKPLIQLSNGENKRVQLALALLGDPQLLILDNPFLGLDAEGRATLHTMIDRLAASGIQLLLVTGPHELPRSITHVAQLDLGKWVSSGPRESFHAIDRHRHPALDDDILAQLSIDASGSTGHDISGPAGRDFIGPAGRDFTYAVRMRNTTVCYGKSTILKGIDWEVRRGERWSVSGPNGAGKSTLLSLITADNPQAYANEIWLFDRRRGSGESIWDIKKKIGFVSPEMHLHFDTAATGFEVVASGLFDTIGLFRILDADQETLVLQWLRLLSLHDLRTRRLAQLSTGQQRLVLLARALVKNPSLLILDEPCQGLDEEQTAWFRTLVTRLCEAFGTTLIYVSHYPDELPACIDHWLRLEQGTITAAISSPSIAQTPPDHRI